MLRWTTSHPFPPNQAHFDLVFSTRIGNSIWITVAEEEYMSYDEREEYMERMHFIVFDSDTKTYTKVECKYDGPIPIGIYSIASHGDHIYMLGSSDCAATEEEDESDDEEEDSDEFRLLRLDTKTLVWEEFMRIEIDEYSKLLIHDDRIYLVESSQMTIIDLETKKLVVHKLKKIKNGSNMRCNREAVAINGDIYIISYIGTNRYIGLFKDGKVTQLKNDTWQKEDVIISKTTNGSSGSILYTPYHGTYYLDTFDPENCQWNRQIVEKCWRSRRSDRINSFWEIDGKMYTIMQSQSSRLKYEIKVLDMKPDLSTICCLNIVDELQRTTLRVAENMTKSLPYDIRVEVENMYKWRAEERRDIRKVAYKRKLHIAKQRSIEAKRRNGTMDEEESYRLQMENLYDSDDGAMADHFRKSKTHPALLVDHMKRNHHILFEEPE